MRKMKGGSMNYLIAGMITGAACVIAAEIMFA